MQWAACLSSLKTVSPSCEKGTHGRRTDGQVRVLRSYRSARRAGKGEEMTVNGFQELEEMAVKLEATARKLPQGSGRDDLLRDVASFRAQLAARLPANGK